MRVGGDAAARLRALTDLGSSLLVEAAAGTGKTALLAGRVTALLATGVEPGSIAAITFTDLAAAELSARVHQYVSDLIAGVIPPPLRSAWPDGVDAARREALGNALGRLDQLTTATIHSFCQGIIRSHAVEAGVDPGAQILDAPSAEATFDAVFERWLGRRLGGLSRSGDPIAAMSRDDPLGVSRRLRDLARLRLRYRNASAPAPDLTGRPDLELAEAVGAFRHWTLDKPTGPDTLALVADLDRLATHFSDSFEVEPCFEVLWRLAHPPRLASMRPDAYDLRRPRLRGKWQRVAGPERGADLGLEAERLFGAADNAYRAILGRVATALCAAVSTELDEAMSDYTTLKQAAAVLDFDDLLEGALSLVSGHEPVRISLGRRYRHILVDEFQDTDPLQAEILFRIASDGLAPRWQDVEVRAGALFLVGDPKQSVYRFRGADVACYADARAAFEKRWPGNVLRLTSNFRSRPAVLQHVNRCFAAPLSGPGQPGYVALEASLAEQASEMPSVVTLAVDVVSDARPSDVRDAEAEVVADACVRLIGTLPVRTNDDTVAPLEPGGIALLTPTSTDLWRYERALEARGLRLNSPAGKGLFRRQEVQDVVALVRAIADAGDTLAFGAVMRGPLVGLTDEEILDVAAALPGTSTAGRPLFSILTHPDDVVHPGARRALRVLRELRKKSRNVTPATLLSEAAQRMALGPITAARGDDGQRAMANVEALIERARLYDVSGLNHFAADIGRDWSLGTPAAEGRLDTDGDAIEVITIHSAKGLEWPVVIPINFATRLRSRETFVHRMDDRTLHWILGDVVPPDLESALRHDEDGQARERERLLYVACTRARELLVLPGLNHSDPRCWASVVDMAQKTLPELKLGNALRAPRVVDGDAENGQTRELFAAERALIDLAATPTIWSRPSDADLDRLPVARVVAPDLGDAPEATAAVGAGRLRGLLLHKILEEVLNGELDDDVPAFVARATSLAPQLVTKAGSDEDLPDPLEIAGTAWKTLRLPEIEELRPSLVPEWPVYAWNKEASTTRAIAGRVDAVAFDGPRIVTIVDWKSDVAPAESDIAGHARQISEYMRATGATRSALVYMTAGLVRWISASDLQFGSSGPDVEWRCAIESDDGDL